MTKQELRKVREELRKQLEELKAIEAEVNKEEEEYRFLKLRETKRIFGHGCPMNGRAAGRHLGVRNEKRGNGGSVLKGDDR